jgi:hypothetical protein
LSRISAEYELGHISVVDSLFLDFKGKGCYSDVEVKLKVLEIMERRYKQDNYKIDEANAIHSEIEKIEDSIKQTSIYHPYRLGVAFNAGSYTNMGAMSGWAVGLLAGYHSRNSDGLGVGIDITAAYERIPFKLNINKSKENNNYVENGFLVNTRGYNSAIGVSALVSLNFIEPMRGDKDAYARDKSKPFGFGVVFGPTLDIIYRTWLADFYYEHNYAIDKRTNLSPYEQTTTLTFDSKARTKYYDNDLWDAKMIPGLAGGLNVYSQPTDNLVVTVSGMYNGKLRKMDTHDAETRVSSDCVMFSLICNYVFGRNASQK